MRSNFTIRLGGIALSFLLFASCERDVFTGYNEPADIENCKIFISSDPSKASIFLNGKNTGKLTPDTLTWLSSGENKITLKTDYFDDTTATVILSKSNLANLYINFEANSRAFGRLNCISFPTGAEIFLDGTPTNSKTPFIIKNVQPGPHYVKYKYPSHRDDSISVKALSSTMVTAYLDLEDTTKWVSYNTKNSPILSNAVNSVAVDHKNNIWIGTDKGLNRKSGNRWTNFTTLNSTLQSNTINHIAIDNNDGVWLSTTKGIYLLKNSVITDYSFNLGSNNVKLIVCSKKDTIWAAVTGVGLCKFAGDKWIIYNTLNSGLKDNNINCMVVDRYENIWIGYTFYGISFFNRFQWSYQEDLRGIYSILIDDNEKVWAGTILHPMGFGYVYYHNGEKWVMINKRELTMSNLTLALHCVRNKVFTGTLNGLGIINEYTDVKFFGKGNLYLDPLRVQTQATDLNENLWFGTPFHGCGVLKKENL